MNSAEAFARAVGGRLAHVTACVNLPPIVRDGLMSAHALAERADVDPSTLLLRRERRCIGTAVLNHQQPIVHGLKSARNMLDGHSPESWAAQLDKRVFLWPAAKVTRFTASIQRNIDATVIWLDPTLLAEAMLDYIDLSPLNSGSFEQGAAHARRGDWLYVPLSAGIEQFRINRMARGLKSTRDQVREVSLRATIPPDLLHSLRQGSYPG